VIQVAQPVGPQLPVYQELLELARDYFEGDWHSLEVQMRIIPLICGASGGGKTFLVGRLAEELGIPLFKTSIGDWILLGANHRGAPPTVPRLYTFIDHNPCGIVFIDEVEKLGTDFMESDWRKFLKLEVFGILDRAISRGVLEEPDGPKYILDAEQLQNRFRHSFFLIAAGAWQSLWSDDGQAVGFSTAARRVSSPTHKQLATTLPPEILNRFSSRVLLMPPFSAGDYRQILAEIIVRLPLDLRAVLQDPEDEVIAEAVRSHKGFRFFEELLADGIRARRISKTPSKTAVEQQHASEQGPGCAV
jgi:hypothetical protein